MSVVVLVCIARRRRFGRRSFGCHCAVVFSQAFVAACTTIVLLLLSESCFVSSYFRYHEHT